MSYDLIESGLKRLLENSTSAFARDAVVAQGDYLVLGLSKTYYVVLVPGPFNQIVHSSPRGIITEWTIFADVFVKMEIDLKATYTRIRKVRDALLDVLNDYASIQTDSQTGGVSLSLLVENGAQPDLWQGDAGQFWRQRFALKVPEKRYYKQDIYGP